VFNQFPAVETPRGGIGAAEELKEKSSSKPRLRPSINKKSWGGAPIRGGKIYLGSYLHRGKENPERKWEDEGKVGKWGASVRS